jgi:hypothetical protein
MVSEGNGNEAIVTGYMLTYFSPATILCTPKFPSGSSGNTSSTVRMLPLVVDQGTIPTIFGAGFPSCKNERIQLILNSFRQCCKLF